MARGTGERVPCTGSRALVEHKAPSLAGEGASSLPEGRWSGCWDLNPGPHGA